MGKRMEAPATGGWATLGLSAPSRELGLRGMVSVFWAVNCFATSSLIQYIFPLTLLIFSSTSGIKTNKKQHCLMSASLPSNV